MPVSNTQQASKPQNPRTAGVIVRGRRELSEEESKDFTFEQICTSDMKFHRDFNIKCYTCKWDGNGRCTAKHHPIRSVYPKGHDKVNARRGGMPWTEQEKWYLYEQRNCKVPYKVLASILERTELSCRLRNFNFSKWVNEKKEAARKHDAAAKVESDLVTKEAKEALEAAHQLALIATRPAVSTGSIYAVLN